MYNGKSLAYSGQTRTYPAVIDTGSSFVAVPPEEYQVLKESWRQSLPNLDCDQRNVFC